MALQVFKMQTGSRRPLADLASAIHPMAIWAVGLVFSGTGGELLKHGPSRSNRERQRPRPSSQGTHHARKPPRDAVLCALCPALPEAVLRRPGYAAGERLLRTSVPAARGWLDRRGSAS